MPYQILILMSLVVVILLLIFIKSAGLKVFKEQAFMHDKFFFCDTNTVLNELLNVGYEFVFFMHGLDGSRNINEHQCFP